MTWFLPQSLATYSSLSLSAINSLICSMAKPWRDEIPMEIVTGIIVSIHEKMCCSIVVRNFSARFFASSGEIPFMRSKNSSPPYRESKSESRF